MLSLKEACVVLDPVTYFKGHEKQLFTTGEGNIFSHCFGFFTRNISVRVCAFHTGLK